MEFLLQLLNTEGEYLLRVIVACICGGIIGTERTLRQKFAGFRTHVIVALGAALMMIVSKYGFFDVVVHEGITLDAGKVASNIITGISFLGAGMIFLKNGTISGLTTAAGIWSTAAVGMAIGSGMYVIGILSTLLILFIQVLFHTFLIGYDKVLASDRTQEVIIKMNNSLESIEKLKAKFAENKIEIVSSKIEINDNILTIVLSAKSSVPLDMDISMQLMDADPNIRSVSL